MRSFEQEISKIAAVGMKPGMEVIRELLRQLGNPQENTAVIHVAGTNGKGSVCAMLERCLREAGFRTGMYTSPHMMYYNERFLINGEMISEEDLLNLLSDVEIAVRGTEKALGERPKEFEILTAMAFLWFSRQNVDLLILETGMGGRFDATNVCDTPLLSIITSISMDHENYLGNTLTLIAGEKAGIIKAGSSLVTSCDAAEALAVLRQEFKAVQKGAPGEAPGARMLLVKDLCEWETKSLGLAGQEVTLKTPLRTYEGLFLPKPGEYQCANLACAILAWELLAGDHSPLPAGKERLNEESLRKGLAALSWPCRLEQVRESPAVVLDGSHNPDGIRQLAIWLSGERDRYDRVILVMGMLEDKDRLSATAQLDGLVSRVIITKPLSDRAGHWEDLARGFRRIAEDQVEFIEDCHQALRQAIALAGENDLVLCTGSLYLVGELRKNWKEKDLF
ncbi:MAG: bifunctional folylpolyglutamate synthase/dihydrofolate synthase [Clostridiales bacterium]|nr:bifunctional folylpolyglutamate synthase/dihydrofolate synthase [Clostridiales bacterium]